VISGLDIKGTVYIDADNVTIENCKITSSDFAVVRIANGVTGAVVRNSEVNGLNSGGQGISGQGTFIGNDISGVADGINVTGDNVLIQDNYIHNLGGTADSHYDGIQIDGGVSGIRVEHNTVVNHHDQTAAVMIDDYFGPTSNVVVNNNLLTGGGYTIYVTGLDGNGTTNVSVTNNHLGEGQWGYTYFAGANPVYSGNVNDGHAIADTLNGQGNDTDGGTPTTPPVTEEPAPTTPPTSTSATEGADTLTGNANANVIDGKGGNDIIGGAGGNDTIFGGLGYDTVTGGSGNDVFAFRSAAEVGRGPGARDVVTDFAQGQDKIDLSAIDANGSLTGNQDFAFVAANNGSFTKTAGEIAWRTDATTNRTIVQGDVNGDGLHDFELELKGTVSLKASDFVGLGTSTTAPTAPTAPVSKITGTTGADRLDGTAVNNYLDGLAGNDTLNGGAGNDVLYGGLGRDIMSGGTGNDIFQFKSTAEIGSTAYTRDVITDFMRGQDKIDLSVIDASSKLSADQAFTFLAADNQAFTHKAGELAWHIEGAKNRTIVQGDTNGDGVHDFEIQLTGQIHLGAGDFIL
jgi:Ca2+-binding RTX toxin-like protein